MKSDQLSKTAAFVAVKFYGMTRMKIFRSCFDEKVVRFYEQLVQSLPSPLNRYYRALQKRWLRNFFIRGEELLLPGDLLHIIMRKFFIGQQTEQLLTADYEQLLVLGAGFDHLAAIYSQRGVTSMEIDVPGVIRTKQEILAKYGYRNSRFSLEPGHIGKKSLGRILSANRRLDPTGKTVVVAEGFFDYLPPEKMKDILEGLSTFFKYKVRVISTIFALDELPAFRRWIFKTAVSAVGEKIRLGLSQNEIQRLFIEKGFSTDIILSSQQMKDRLSPAGLRVLEGFYLLACEMKKN